MAGAARQRTATAGRDRSDRRPKVGEAPRRGAGKGGSVPARPARSASPVVRDALLTWLLTRVSVVILAVAGSWLLARGTAGFQPGFVELWDRWDVAVFVKIARFGYLGYPRTIPTPAPPRSSPVCRAPCGSAPAHHPGLGGRRPARLPGGRRGGGRGTRPPRRGRPRRAGGVPQRPLPRRLPVRGVPGRRVLRGTVPGVRASGLAGLRGSGAGCWPGSWAASRAPSG